jgi:hypothetical protein
MVSFWRTASVCHFAPLFYLALYPLPYSQIYSKHKSLQSKFTHHTHVHAHTDTHGDYSHSLRSQTNSTRRSVLSNTYKLRVLYWE